ncbi:acyl-CoA dehydrogenase [Streptomyces sp. NPDC048297]|uniref:acyl-CoA dehydrogenase family protein n=1 Tax=Streptomyces sp. NPDC048297 TaxID=3365531 RepID=UPI003718EF76
MPSNRPTHDTHSAPTGGNALHRLIHGACEPAFRTGLHKALAATPFRTAVEPDDRDAYLDTRLRDVSRALPPAHRLLNDPDRLAELMAWTGVADPRLCMNLVTHLVLGQGSISRFGADEAELTSVREELERGDAKCGYLITEAGNANSHLATRTTAVFDPETRTFALRTPDDGAAKFGGVSSFPGRRLAVVLARLRTGQEEHGVYPFLVELADDRGLRPGVRLSPPMPLTDLPLNYVLVSFDDVKVPYSWWLRDDATIDSGGTPRDPLGSEAARLQRTLSVGRELWATLPAAAAAQTRQSAVLALHYARGRRTQARLAPGTPLFEFPGQRHAILGALAEAFALTCAAARARDVLRTVQAPDEGGERSVDEMEFSPWAAVSRSLSAYKAHAARTASRVIAHCQSLCGYSGLLDANRLAGYHGFLRAFDPAGGDSQLIYYDLGQRLADEVGSTPLGDIARPRDVTDVHWWPAVLRAHERGLAVRLRQARDARLAEGHDDFGVWGPLLELAGELGETYAARLAADDVAWAVQRFVEPDDVPAHEAFTTLAALNATRAGAHWAGRLLTAGTVSRQEMSALAESADQLCERLLPHLPQLEEAFAYPDDIVHAPSAPAEAAGPPHTTPGQENDLS